jgi:hypothetical protein
MKRVPWLVGYKMARHGGIFAMEEGKGAVEAFNATFRVLLRFERHRIHIGMSATQPEGGRLHSTVIISMIIALDASILNNCI